MNGVTVVHAMPGEKPVLMFWGHGELVRKELSDREALQIAADLVQAVVMNERTKK